ncbi:MAG: putative NAD/FAD-binding protein [Myxococcota bacterium]|jgi:predicted NAD/FAD-binding protein
MEIAVIGGGTAGLATAWMLDPAHRVTVLESEPVLGGHVRTLGGNVPAAGELGLGDTTLDAGVVLLERSNFPNTHRLMDRVGARRRPVSAPVTMTATPGRSILTPEAVGWLPRRKRPRYLLRGVRPTVQRAAFLDRTAHATMDSLYANPLQAYLQGDPMATWMRTLMMYAFSTPFAETSALPAALTVPLLRRMVFGGEWSGFVGGAWAWLEALIDDMGVSIETEAAVEQVLRDDDGVEVRVNGATCRFDHVVFATPPGAILPLLAHPDRGERRRLGAWRSRSISTQIHDDDLHDRWGVPVHTPFDMVKGRDGWGYTATLNPMSGLPVSGRIFQLAFGLESEIAPDRVLHSQRHITPEYTVDALRARPEVRAWQGHRRTWIVGAWLGNGLQEGAVTSAMQVAQRLGGRGF